MKKTIQQDGEQIIDSWTLNCILFDSPRMLGKLYVTKNKLYFEAQYDSSFSGLLKNVTTSAIAASGHALLVAPEIMEKWKNKGYVSISKKDISNISEKSSFLKKTVILNLSDGNKVVFDYGMLGVKKLIQAIEQ
jgi:hypothetical protein